MGLHLNVNRLLLPSSGHQWWAVKEWQSSLTRILKNSWMEFLFSSFLGTLAASSPAWEAAAAGLLSTTGSDVLAAGFGSSLGLTVWAGSAAAAGAGLDFLGSEVWKWCRMAKWMIKLPQQLHFHYPALYALHSLNPNQHISLFTCNAIKASGLFWSKLQRLGDIFCSVM